MNYDERVELAKVAYGAYGDTAGWKNFQGNPMPRWEDLGQRIQVCWAMAVSAVVDYVTPPSQR